MLYRLVVITGPLKGQRITVDPDPMKLGRDTDCDIVLPDDEAALVHAQIEHRPEGLFIRDLGSMNKLIVNKREVQESRLKHGDTVEIGRTRFLVQAVVQAEVQGLEEEAEQQEKRSSRRSVIAALAAALVIGAVLYWLIGHDKELPIQTSEASVPASANPAVDLELEQLKEDLLSIRQAVDSIADTTGITAAAEQTLTNKAEPDEPAPAEPAAEVDETEAIMTAAQQAIASGDFVVADKMLEHLQLTRPDYLPSYEIRAGLYEQWGMPGKAREQWTVVLQRTTESPLYRKAVAERIRLGHTESLRTGQAGDALSIASVDQLRFRAGEEYDEMRIIKVDIRYDASKGTIDPEGLRLIAHFFEEDRETGEVRISEAMPEAEATLESIRHEVIPVFSVAATYVVPRGYYDRQSRDIRYHGFLLQLRYKDAVLAEYGRPAALEETYGGDQFDRTGSDQARVTSADTP